LNCLALGRLQRRVYALGLIVDPVLARLRQSLFGIDLLDCRAP
jgi:hypothetical protein